MKFFLAISFLLLLIIQSATSQEWETLDTVNENPGPIIGRLRTVGADYVLQKAMFESSKVTLPAKGYYLSTDIEKVERKNVSDGLTDYRFTVTFKETHDVNAYQGESLINAVFTVSYRESNGNFIVTSYKFDLDPYGNPPEEDGFEDTDGYAGRETTLIDTRLLNNGTSSFSKLFENATEFVIAQAIERGELPNSDYKIEHVYGADDFEEYGHTYLRVRVKLSNSQGNYFLLYIRIEYWQEEEGGDIEPIGNQNYEINLPVQETGEENVEEIGVVGEAGESEGEVGEVGETEGEFEEFGEDEGSVEGEEIEEIDEIEEIEGVEEN